MFEHEESCVDKAIPGDDPVSMGFDGLGRRRRSLEYLKVFSEFDDVVGVVGDRVDVGKNMVEVDGIPIE